MKKLRAIIPKLVRAAKAEELKNRKSKPAEAVVEARAKLSKLIVPDND